MTEPSDSAEATDDAPDTTADRLLLLQRIDTDADQLINRRERLAEREQLAAATSELSTWESRRTTMSLRLEELSGVIEQAEADAAEIAEHKQRLEAQMKTVIAPREAEALMHEISTLDAQTDALDMKELEALEEQSDVDDTLTAHLGQQGPLSDAVSGAEAALAQACSEVDAELSQLEAARTAARGELSDSVLSRYDRVRASSGVAVAKLSGHLCEGCHLDLSAAEIDDVKDEAATSDGVADCPNCGRMLAL
ncbi:MAG: zinc ribbon domain-containing protein [Ilumatobacter sp.]